MTPPAHPPGASAEPARSPADPAAPATRARHFGWSIVAATFAVQAIAIGFSISLYPVFMESFEVAFGASRTLTSFGIPALVIGGACVAPWIGSAIDRGSPRPLMLGGVLMLGAGLALLPSAPSLALAGACWMGLVGLGSTLCGALPAMTVLANWFVLRRATMISLAAVGTTAAGAIVPPIAEALIAWTGWRDALRIFGAACAVLGAPVVLLGIVKRPEERGLFPDGVRSAPPPPALGAAQRAMTASDILRRPQFWFLAAGFALITGMTIGFVTHIVPFAVERGLSREQAVALLSINAVATAIGKLGFGVLTDRLGPLRAVWLGIAIQASGWNVLLFVPGGPAFAAGAVCFALGTGCMMPCQAGFVGDLFGREHFGRASGLLGPVAILGIVAVAPAIGAAYEWHGSYGLPMTFALAIVLLPALLLTFAVAVPLPPAAAEELA